MSRRTELVLLALILLAALALRVIDLRGVPPGAQHDEVFSANFATQILNGARPAYWDQNGGVPPFHAYLVAPVFALFGSSIVTLRLVSVVCGLLVVVFTYLSARRLFGAAVALFSAALIAATQWHLFESRVGLEPVTLMLMASITAWLFVVSHVRSPMSTVNNCVLDRGHWTWDILTGLALGLTFYTYQSSPLVFLALAAFAGYRLVVGRARFRAAWRSLALTFLIALLVLAPLVVHFLTTAGDATSRPEDLASDLRAALSGDFGPIAGDIAGVAGMLAFTGDPSSRYNLPGRPVFTLPLGLLAYAGMALALWRRRDPRYAFVVIWVGCNVLASAVTRASPSYLRSSAALPFIAMLPGMALAEIWRWRQSRLASDGGRQTAGGGGRTSVYRLPSAVLIALALALIATEAASTTHDYFVAWANLEPVRSAYRADLAEIARFLDTQRPAGTLLLSARFPFDLDQESLYLLQKRHQHYQWFNGRRVLVLPDDRSGQGVGYFIPASNASLGDGAALLQTLAARPGPPDDSGRPAFTLYDLPAAQLAQLRARVPQIALHANASNEVELIGVDASVRERTLHLLLYWRVLLRVRGDLDRNFFAHLVDARGTLWTQEDRSAYPTSSWQDDDIVWQWYDLTLPPAAPAGDYSVELGIYDANAPAQPRLNILDANGNVLDNHVTIGPFQMR
jgi:4-amino-4-deoxy-L-arabinose transferase-like glycosyltransferase